MKFNLSDITILIVVGLLLLAFDRYYRIEGFINAIQCGVHMPSCPAGTKCENGYCGSTNPPKLKPTTLPVFP